MDELFTLIEDPGLPSLTAHGVHPFSVLRTDLRPWQARKAAWNELGLASRAGREHVRTYQDTTSAFARSVLADQVGLSTFDPVLAETNYTWYCPPGGRVLDPFAGGSVRGLVAGNLGYRYTGVDLSAQQIDANEDQAADWAARDQLAAKVEWIHGDAAEVVPTMRDSAYDYVMTCPPYHRLERYSDDPADLSAMGWAEFCEAYTRIVAATVEALAPDRFCTWVVGEIRGSNGHLRGLAPLTIAAHEAAGAHLYNDAVLLNVIGTTAARLPRQWRASRKMGRIHQYVLTFIKGDPKAATYAASGQPEPVDRPTLS